MGAILDVYQKHVESRDLTERILPTADGEISFVFSRHKFAYLHVQQFVENKTVIDIGCGTGYGCKILAEKAKLVYGIDHNAEAIAYCHKYYGAPNVKYLQMDAASLKLDSQFDIGVTFQVIEHLRDVEDFVDQLKRIVKSNGLIFISTPNVRVPKKEGERNPFHFSEMSYDQFNQLLGTKFVSFEILGVGYASRNRLRSLLKKMPFYEWGKALKRNSKLKKVANHTLGLTSFKIISNNVEQEALDLLAVCRNN